MTLANDRIDLRFQPASIHALIGENGAGKSTLMRILFGLLRPDAGEVRIGGRLVELGSPAEALRLGIGMIHQHFMLVPPMTVLENVILGYAGLRGLRALPRAELAERFRRLVAAYGFDLDPHDRVETLGVGERQRVEIARLLFHGARVLICDEPTAVLAPPEVAGLFRVLRLLREEGRTIILITHKLTEVLEIADRVSVLRQGRIVGEAERAQLDRERLVRWIMGAELSAVAERASPAVRPAPSGARESAAEDVDGAPHGLLAVRQLTLRGDDGRARLRGIDLTLRAGEILGIAGVQGNGQRELAEVLAGRRRFESGEMQLGDLRIGPGGLAPQARRPALIPEDRSTEGLIGGMTLWENLLLGQRERLPFLRRGWYAHAPARRWAQPLIERFRVRPARVELPADALSGGNQQKLLCAREISGMPAVLVASQPTRGIDLASTRFLHDLLRDLRRRGGGVILISADLDEILELSDRVAVLYRGTLSGPWPRAEVDTARLGRAMVGVAS